jgi:hypothetical protein
MALKFIIAPMAAGKSTFARATFAVDADAARNPDHEGELKVLREARDWDAHNKIWHADLSAWSATLPDNTTVLCHSLADAQAMAQPDSPIVAVLPSPSVMAEHYRKRALDEEEMSLARLNYSTVEAADVPKFENFTLASIALNQMAN